MHETTCRKQKRQSAITAPINTDQKASSKPELFRKKALTSILSLRTKEKNKTHAKRIFYKKYSPAPLLPAGTARLWSGTALKILKSGSRSSPSVMMEATLPQR